MDLSTTSNRALGLDPDDIGAEYASRHFADLADEQLFDLTASIVAVPKQDPANSFVLHAPLELLARRSLLRFVAPDRRETVRERMVWVAATYERASESVEPGPERAFDSPAVAAATLADAAAQKDLVAVDAAAAWLGQHGSTGDVMKLADAVIDSLAAAGHAGIYFSHLGRAAAHSRAALGLLRPLAREVARWPELRIEWVRDGVAETSGPVDADGARFAEALARTPRLGLPGSDFIFPTVHQVDAGGHARDIIDAAIPLDFPAAAAAILRVAAWSMLQDDPTYAPYGWTHCLTLPQSVLGLAPWLSSETRAAAIAATYVVAFRAAEGSRDIDLGWTPEPVAVPLVEALDADPVTASSAAYFATDDEFAAVVPELAGRAASHEDAHLAKYTLACFEAAAQDPGHRRLYLASAAYLGAWWSAR